MSTGPGCTASTTTGGAECVRGGSCGPDPAARDDAAAAAAAAAAKLPNLILLAPDAGAGAAAGCVAGAAASGALARSSMVMSGALAGAALPGSRTTGLPFVGDALVDELADAAAGLDAAADANETFVLDGVDGLMFSRSNWLLLLLLVLVLSLGIKLFVSVLLQCSSTVAMPGRKQAVRVESTGDTCGVVDLGKAYQGAHAFSFYRIQFTGRPGLLPCLLVLCPHVLRAHVLSRACLSACFALSHSGAIRMPFGAPVSFCRAIP